MRMASESPYVWKKHNSNNVNLSIPGQDSHLKNHLWYRHQDVNEANFSMSGLAVPGVPDSILSVQLNLPPNTSHAITFGTIQAAVRQLRFDHPAIAICRAWLDSTPPRRTRCSFMKSLPPKMTSLRGLIRSCPTAKTHRVTLVVISRPL